MKPVDLHAAADRLRENPPPGFPRRVGRPRKHAAPAVTAPNGVASSGSESPSVGTGWAHPIPRTRVNSGRGDGARAYEAPALPRLLDVRGAAAYLGVSTWTLRELVSRGVLPRVRVPLPASGELRKVLLDREDLDRLVEAWKDAAP